MTPPGATGPVGVVIPAFDAADFIAETVASLRAQTIEDWFCVIVDDGSRDATPQILRELVGGDPRFDVVRQPNAGASAARNVALARLPTEVELVAFLDADDTWLPVALERLTEALQSRPDAVGAYGYAEYMDAAGRPHLPGLHSSIQRERRRLAGSRLVDVPETNDATFDVLHVVGPIWPSAVALHRRKAIERAGGLDPTFSHLGDWDLYLRMSRSGPFVTVPQQVAWYRRHASNLTTQDDEAYFQYGRLRRKTFLSPANTPAQRRDVLRSWRYLELVQVRRQLALLRGAVRARQGRVTARRAAALLVQLAQLPRVGPPPAKRTRSRLLHVPKPHLLAAPAPSVEPGPAPRRAP